MRQMKKDQLILLQRLTQKNSEPKENANASDTDDADNSSNTAINKATDFS